MRPSSQLVELLRRWAGPWPSSLPPALSMIRVADYGEYETYAAAAGWEHAQRTEREWQLARSGGPTFHLAGYCYPCRARTRFLVDYQYTDQRAGAGIPNWRERLECERCGLNSRLRATIQVFEQECTPGRLHDIYLTEQSTPLFRYCRRTFPGVVGSEFLGAAAPYGSTNGEGLRNETLTSLTFATHSLGAVLCFDVLEHVPDYSRGLSEVLRVLRPNGLFLFSVPFALTSPDTLVRARHKADGTIDHLLPPEYHGDPLAGNGILCFRHFGWDLLQEMRQMGFRDVEALLYWSEELGYLGPGQFLFQAWAPQ